MAKFKKDDQIICNDKGIKLLYGKKGTVTSNGPDSYGQYIVMIGGTKYYVRANHMDHYHENGNSTLYLEKFRKEKQNYQKEIDSLNSKISLVDDKIEYLESSGTKFWDATTYKAYMIMKVSYDDSLNKEQKTSKIAELLKN